MDTKKVLPRGKKSGDDVLSPQFSGALLPLSILGFSAGMALEFYALFYRVNNLPQINNAEGNAAVLQVLFFLTLCIAYMWVSRNAKLFYQYRHVALLIVSLCILAPLFIHLLSKSAPDYELFFLAIEWFLLGAGICGLRTLWELFYSLYFTKSCELFISLSFIGASFFTLCLISLSENMIWFIAVYAAIVVVSAILGALLLRGISPKREKLITSSKQFSPYVTSDIVANGAQGIVFGYCISTLINFGALATLPIALSLLLGSSFALLIPALRRQRNYSLALLLSRLLPIAIFFLLLSPLLGRSLQILCSCSILTIFVYAQVRKIALGAVINNRLNLNPITHSTLVPLPYAAGTAIGYLSFVIFSQYLMLEHMDLFIATIVYALLVILFYYFASLKLLRPQQLHFSDTPSFSHKKQDDFFAAEAASASEASFQAKSSREPPPLRLRMMEHRLRPMRSFLAKAPLCMAPEGCLGNALKRWSRSEGSPAEKQKCLNFW